MARERSGEHSLSGNHRRSGKQRSTWHERPRETLPKTVPPPPLTMYGIELSGHLKVFVRGLLCTDIQTANLRVRLCELWSKVCDDVVAQILGSWINMSQLLW